MASIKETLEVLAFLRLVPGAVDEIAENGKFGFHDILILRRLIDPAKDALEGVTAVPAELQDLDKAELISLLSEVFAVAKDCATVFHKYVK